MFPKINKKILVILITVFIAILLIGFAVYEYVVSPAVKVQNSAGGAQTEQKPAGTSSDQNKPPINAPQIEIQPGGIQVQGENGGGSLSVCLDKCGDNICQKTDPNCGKDNNLNCICPETTQECPQDCK